MASDTTWRQQLNEGYFKTFIVTHKMLKLTVSANFGSGRKDSDFCTCKAPNSSLGRKVDYLDVCCAGPETVS